MKTLTKFFCASIILLGFSAASFAQVSATATATATIVTPITITNSGNMSFGNVIPHATLTGTVILTPAGAAAYSNVTASALPVLTAPVSAASFGISGTPAATYVITIPTTNLTLNGPGATTMIVNAFTSTPSGTGTLGTPVGTQTLRVGATLNVGAAQAAGTYLSGPFTVTVNYN